MVANLVLMLQKKKRSTRTQEYALLPALLSSEIYSEPKICAFDVLFSRFSSYNSQNKQVRRNGVRSLVFCGHFRGEFRAK